MMSDSQPDGATDMTLDDTANVLMSRWESNEQQDAEEPEMAQETEVETVETEETEADADDVSEESSDQDAEETEETLNFQSLQEIAEALDMSPDDFLENYKGKIKVDGEESEVSLREALSGYQRQADYQRKTAELAEQRRQFEEAVSQRQTELQQNHELANASLQAAQNVLLQEFNGINWQELEATDPGTAALYRQKFQERQNEINGYFSQLQMQRQQDAERMQYEQAQRRNEVLKREMETLRNVAPDWNENVSKEVAQYLKDNNFKDAEIDGLIDHRHALLIRKAMMYDKGQKSVDVAKAKVKNIPKMLKPGSKNKTKNDSRMKDLKGRLKRSGSLQDTAQLLLERMK